MMLSSYFFAETAMGKSVENFERKKLYRKSISEMGKIIIYR